MKYPLHFFESPIVANELISGNSEASFFKSIEVITTVKLLCQMVNAVQQHRGSTMAFIKGNPIYAERAQDLETAIQTGFGLCKTQMRSQHSPIDRSMFDHACADWHTIQRGWRQDGLLDNYEFHNHLVEALTKLRTDCLSALIEDPHLPSQDKEEAEQIIQTLLVRLPDYIEQLARLRGLGATDSVIQASDPESLPRIQFLIKCLREENQTLFEEIAHVISKANVDINVDRLSAQKASTNRLIKRLESKLTNKKSKIKDEESLFEEMTNLINALWHLVNIGVTVIDRKIYQLAFSWRPF